MLTSGPSEEGVYVERNAPTSPTERRRLGDEDLHPWRYSGDREGTEELAY
jgi:hypothetical protein